MDRWFMVASGFRLRTCCCILLITSKLAERIFQGKRTIFQAGWRERQGCTKGEELAGLVEDRSPILGAGIDPHGGEERGRNEHGLG